MKEVIIDFVIVFNGVDNVRSNVALVAKLLEPTPDMYIVSFIRLELSFHCLTSITPVPSSTTYVVFVAWAESFRTWPTKSTWRDV
jgi:hypothetical protein